MAILPSDVQGWSVVESVPKSCVVSQSRGEVNDDDDDDPSCSATC